MSRVILPLGLALRVLPLVLVLGLALGLAQALVLALRLVVVLVLQVAASVALDLTATGLELGWDVLPEVQVTRMMTLFTPAFVTYRATHGHARQQFQARASCGGRCAPLATASVSVQLAGSSRDAVVHRSIVDFLERTRRVHFQLDAKTKLEAEQLYQPTSTGKTRPAAKGNGVASRSGTGDGAQGGHGGVAASEVDSMARLERMADGADRGGVRLRGYLHWGSLSTPADGERSPGVAGDPA